MQRCCDAGQCGFGPQQLAFGVARPKQLAIFRMPADASPANTRGETCDLIVNAGNQQADVGQSNEDVIVIKNIDTTNNTVDVHMNPTNMFTAGVV